jgi:hypothetical protein
VRGDEGTVSVVCATATHRAGAFARFVVLALVLAPTSACTPARPPSPASALASASGSPAASPSSPSVASPSPAASAATPDATTVCGGSYALYVRGVAYPSTPEFDRGAEAFDRATKNWEKKRYGEAGHGFLRAAQSFTTDPAGGANWKWSYENAALCFEVSGRIDEGKVSFEAVAQKEKDPLRAAELRAAAANLTAKSTCP